MTLQHPTTTASTVRSFAGIPAFARWLNNRQIVGAGSHVTHAMLLLVTWWAGGLGFAENHEVEFERVQLSDQFYSEGATFGDYNADGHGDVAIGPWIYFGPEFETRIRFYEGEAFNPAGYSENFLMFSGDIDDDGLDDVIVLGFPGKESWWYENPGDVGPGSETAVWPEHVIMDVVDNESPLMADIDGDGTLDLVCSSGGHYGFASYAGQDPREKWEFVKISPNNGYQRFTHGLGVGDVNNDGHLDLMEKDGWWENPGDQPSADLGGSESRDSQSDDEAYWTFHAFEFSAGGSQMHAVDLTGDGRNEVVTGLAAHGFGLVYYRSLDEAATRFEQVEIMTDQPTDAMGIAVSQLHAVEIADVNRDGVPDIVTGKRWWAHASGDPGSEQPATLLWLETQRQSNNRVRFVPHVIDISSGVGTQVTVGDIDGNDRIDIVCGTKRGAHLFLQRGPGLADDEYLVPGLAEADRFGQRPAHTTLPIEDETGGFRPSLYDRPLNLDFSGNQLLDWELRGTLGNESVQSGSFDSGKNGAQQIGELISRPFALDQPVVSFELAGDADKPLHVEVTDELTGRPLATARPNGSQQLERFYLRVERGNRAAPLVRIRIVDHARDGALRFDDFRLHQQLPTE